MEEKKLNDTEIDVGMIEEAVIDTLKEMAIKFSKDSYIYRVLVDTINLINRQKAEIERLTEEKAELKMEIATQKLKYEALKTGTNIANGFNEVFKGVRETDIRQQTVKDTAKEILQTIKHAKEKGQIYYNESFMITAQKAYGVEVE